MEELFPYQDEGALWLSKRRFALLADEMGLGKTAQVIKACDLVGAKRVLVLCPAAARINWEREFKRFSDSSRSFLVLLSSLDQADLNEESLITSYDLATKLNSKITGPYDVLILDEVHFLKSVDAQRSKAVWGREGLVRKTKRIWAISGTPAPNHAGDLWPLLYTFGVTKLSYDEYVNEYCNYYESPHGRTITGTKMKSIPKLKTQIESVTKRRLKEEVLTELPPIHYDHRIVEAGPVELEMQMSFIPYVFPDDKTKELFEKMKREEELLAKIIKDVGLTREGVLALEAISSSISTLRRYTGLQKVKAVTEIISKELENNAYHKVVIFAVHRDVIESFRLAFDKFDCVTLYGKNTPATKQKNVDRFQNNPHCRVFIGNIQAAGTAITLTAASHVVFAEVDWVPGNNSQAAMRCHRIGQKNPVFVRFIGLANSLDEKVTYILKRKTKELTRLFGDRGLQDMDETDTNLDINQNNGMDFTKYKEVE